MADTGEPGRCATNCKDGFGVNDYTKSFELNCRSGIVPRVQATVGKLTNWAAQTICRHRRAWPWRWVGQLSYLIWRAYENRNFDMATNGEAWLLQQMSKVGAKCVFDVGANVGDWTRLCRQRIPAAAVHAFEIAPPIFAQLQKNVGGLTGVMVNAFGISNETKEIEIYYSEGTDFLTSAYPGAVGKVFTLPNMPVPQVRQIKGRVVCGDDYATEHGVKTIDFLKIDVEGMEGEVLRGFQTMLAEHRVRLIQFEYNATNIVSGFMLRDAHELLEGHGYKLGKLYPNHVEFRDYHYRQEDFCGPNIVAVRADDAELIQLLS